MSSSRLLRSWAWLKTPRWRGFHADVIAVALVLLVWWAAFRRVYQLEWPCETDMVRDMGAAQSVLDGHAGSDPGYLGERWWYNPLIPALVGGLSVLFRTPLHEAYTTFGATLNVLSPVAFYLLLRTLVGPRAGLVGLIGFLFLGPWEFLSWMHATYSPWLWSCNLAQAFFYAALLLIVLALRRNSLRIAAGAGVAVGLVALAHTAPTLILGVIGLVLGVSELAVARFRPAAFGRSLALLGTIALAGAVVASPYWFTVLVHYGGEIRNPVPLDWLAGELRVERAHELVTARLSLRKLLGFAGLVALALPSVFACRRAHLVVCGWLLGCTLGLGYGFLDQKIDLPPLLPSWHFHFYLQALESVLAALGVELLVRAGRTLAARRFPHRPEALRRQVLDAVVVGLLLLLVRVEWRDYLRRPDLRQNREEALRLATVPEIEVYEWALANAAPTDVFLAEGPVGFYVAAAGRKTVFLPSLFSSPFVSQGGRERDLRGMFNALEKGKWSRFRALARKYQVRFVALPAKKRAKLVPETREKLVSRRLTSNLEHGQDLFEVPRHE